MPATIEPEPSQTERVAILEALEAAAPPAQSEWALAALAEGVAADEPDAYPVGRPQR